MLALPKWLTDIKKLFGSADGKVLGRVAGAWVFVSSFAPSAHNSSHATGGSDELAPEDIGAAASGHDHDAAYAAKSTEHSHGNISTLGKIGESGGEPTWEGGAWPGGGAGSPIDLTAATEDYLMGAGETAFIDYSNATSVPLNVATEQGLYRIHVVGTVRSGAPSDNVTLRPNNTSYTGAIRRQNIRCYGGGVLQGYAGNTDYFNISYGGIISAHVSISTITAAKSLSAVGIFIGGSTYYSDHEESLWIDTTTQWSSLGTVTFPFAQSGRIVIQRVI